MTTYEQIEKEGKDAILKLRRARLTSGNFFMINLNSLPDYHCYLEYPDGSIKFAVSESRTKGFTILRELDAEESSNLRKKLGLTLIKI